MLSLFKPLTMVYIVCIRPLRVHSSVIVLMSGGGGRHNCHMGRG